MMNEITNSDDIIDSRDVTERIADLQTELEDAGVVHNMSTGGSESADGATDLCEELAEYKALCALRDEAEGYCEDWRHGAALIRDSYFAEYAQQFAEDIGAIRRDLSWPNDCIDWEKAARELKMDYTAVDFDGVTYWVR